MSVLKSSRLVYIRTQSGNRGKFLVRREWNFSDGTIRAPFGDAFSDGTIGAPFGDNRSVGETSTWIGAPLGVSESSQHMIPLREARKDTSGRVQLRYNSQIQSIRKAPARSSPVKINATHNLEIDDFEYIITFVGPDGVRQHARAKSVVVAMGPYTPEFVRNGKHNVGGFLGQPLGPADLHKTNVIETETWRFEDREGRDGVKAGFPPVFVEHALGGDPEKSV